MSYRLLASSLLAFAGLGIVAGPVAAADLDPGYGLIPPQQEERVEFGTGWYVRGDLGATHGLSVKAGPDTYDASAINNAKYLNQSSYTEGVFEGPGNAAPSIISGGSSALQYSASLGGGYQFNKWFRADATFDFHQPVQSSYQGGSVPCITGTTLGAKDALGNYSGEYIVSTACTPTKTASLRNYAVLFNGYVDLGKWSIVTPYVGAGIGMSFGHATASSAYHMNNTNSYAGVTYTDSLNGATYEQNWDRSRSTQFYNLAFALMGGVAIDVFDHTKLDIGYRYVHLGSILGTNVATQEVRAGLRYMIDN